MGSQSCVFSVPLPDTQVEKSVVVLKLPYLQKNFFRKIILQFVDYGLGHFLVGWKVTSSERAYVTNCINKVCSSQSVSSLSGHCWPMPLQETLITQKEFWLCLGVVPGYRCTKCFIEHLAWLVGIDSEFKFTPATVLLRLYLCLGHVLFFFFGGTQHSPFNGHSTTRCNFGAITGKDEFTPFYFAIFTSSQEQTRKGGNAYIPLLHFLHLSALSNRLESHWQSQGHLFSSRMPVLSQCRTLCYHAISLTWWYYLWHVNRECASWWADPRQHYPRAFL